MGPIGRSAVGLALALTLSFGNLLAQSSVETGSLSNLAAGAKAEASSAVSGKYAPASAVDGNPATWWACAQTAKPPQTLKVTLSKPVEVDTLVLLKAQNPTLYANLREVALRFDNGSKVSHTLRDDLQPEVVRFPPRRVASVEITVLNTYGEKRYFGLAELMAFRDPREEVLVSAPTPPAPKDAWHNVKLTQLGREQHPCVYLTPADVQRARKNVQRWPWAKEYAASIVKVADEWLNRPDDWFVKQLPPKGACFAYGFTGCPICSAKWGTWGGARCSWDKPGKVTCENGHVLPDADHPDPGAGYVGKDGRIHYFIGSYNAWVVENLESPACSNLALAYTLTGDERYAHKAAGILDALAGIYPGCTSGSWDYPSKPPSGRFSRPWYQVSRVLVRYVDHHDQIFHSKSLDEPSIVPGPTRRQNIEENLLKNGAWYCYEQSLKGGLNNGEADYIRGSLAVGCLLGIPQYVEWALDGPYGILTYLANNVDRDGRYCETSMMYSIHTRDLYLTFSEPLLHWTRPTDLYADVKFKAFFTLPELATNCLGRIVPYGDSGPDVVKRFEPPRKFSSSDYAFAERLCGRASTPEDKAAFGALAAYLAGGDMNAARAASRSAWLLFNAEEPPATKPKLPESLDRRLNRTDFLGREGIGVLRAGEGRDAQALLLRYGQSLNHGHLDDLNINYYALGREITYDLGYGLGSTHTQVGWSHQTASHNLVVVNEKTQGGGPRAASGGSLLFTADTPLAQVVEAESANSYGHEGVTKYRRLCALVGEGRQRYLLDVFRVTGGKQHDYMFHCPIPAAEAASRIGGPLFEVSGLALGPEEKGSLAGPDVEWGNLQLNDGDMRGHPNKPYWRPPPGNGYGFLVQPQRARTDEGWAVTWRLGEESAVRLHMLGVPGTEVITAIAPGILPKLPKARYVVGRRRGEGLSSVFVAVIEPCGRPDLGLSMDATSLAASAKPKHGVAMYISRPDVLLFKGTGKGAGYSFTRRVEQAGEYVILAHGYPSARYGRAQLAVDGRALPKDFTGSRETAEAFELGRVSLTPGEHTLSVELLSPSEGGDWWIGVQGFTLIRPDELETMRRATIETFIESVRPLSPSAPSTGVEVRLRDGTADQIEFKEGFTLTRMRDSRRIGGCQVLLNAWRGKVLTVDYERNVVTTDAPLPADGRLTGGIVCFSNPAYTRNTPYRIAAVTQADDKTTISLGDSTLLLGKGRVSGAPPDRRTLVSLIPHEYARAKQQLSPNGFFTGKLIRTAGGKKTTRVLDVISGQPLIVRVEDSRPFQDGDDFFYCDVQPGDEFAIHKAETY